MKNILEYILHFLFVFFIISSASLFQTKRCFAASNSRAFCSAAYPRLLDRYNRKARTLQLRSR